MTAECEPDEDEDDAEDKEDAVDDNMACPFVSVRFVEFELIESLSDDFDSLIISNRFLVN